MIGMPETPAAETLHIEQWAVFYGACASRWLSQHVDTESIMFGKADGSFLVRRPVMPGMCPTFLAGVVVEDWNGVTGVVTAVVDPKARWCRAMSRFFDRAVRVRPFEHLKYECLTSFVSADNLASIRFTERMGATREATLRGAGVSCTGSGKAVDLHVYTMRQGDYARKRYD